MAKCPKCGHEVVQVTYADAKVLLDPTPRTYGAVEEHHIWPEDGDRVFRSTALVEHAVVCPREGAAHAQERQRAATLRQKGMEV